MLIERDIFVERMQRNLAVPAPQTEKTGEDLLNLFLSLPPKQRLHRFADTARAAEITGLTQRTIQMWIEFGSIRAVHVGRKYQIDLDSLKSYLLNRAEE